MTKTYKLRHKDKSENETLVDWTVEEILEMINRDRSDEWLCYDETDWQEGLEFTDYELIPNKRKFLVFESLRTRYLMLAEDEDEIYNGGGDIIGECNIHAEIESVEEYND